MNEFRHDVGIYELDIYGHANHVQFLHWLEEGRERLLRSKGLSFIKLGKSDRRLVIVNVTLNYLSPVMAGETIAVETSVEKVGRTSVNFSHRIRKSDDDHALAGTCTMVFIDDKGAPAAVPDEFRQAFSS